MGVCELCGKGGSRLEANHKELGRIMVCRECWSRLYDENRMTCSVGASGGSCSCCR
jgi:ribosome-binding protein aMBF1 (putative translation factor)